MLSRFLLKSGKTLLRENRLCLRVATSRLSSTSVTDTNNVDALVVDSKYPKRLNDWENYQMPGAPYEGMGPLPPLPDFDPKMLRHYVVPEYWFQFLYPRTGATGLYALAAGLSAMLVSKEFYVYTPDTWYTFAFFGTVAIVNKYAGPYIRDFYEEARVNKILVYEQVKDEEVKDLLTRIEETKLEQWRSGAQELFNEAKKVNLSMMLETEYLQRQKAVIDAVKNKLDYQVAVQKVDTELAHGHMVKWIEQKIMDTLTPASQKATLSSCINQLNAIKTS